MERRQLEHFLALCEVPTFSGAAGRVGLSQPAFSQSIRALEDDLQTTLFERRSSGVVLTDPGRRLAPLAADIVRNIGAARQTVQAHPTCLRGVLHIMCPATLLAAPLLPQLEEFRRREPDVRFEIHDPRTPAELHESIVSGRVDCAVVTEPAVTPGLAAVSCGTQRIMAVLPAAARPVDQNLLSLLTHGVVCSPRGRTVRTLLESAVGPAAVARAVVVETDQSGMVGALVHEGVGIGFVPEEEALELQDEGLRVVPTEPVLTRPVFLLHRPSNPSPELSAFLAAVHVSQKESSDGAR